MTKVYPKLGRVSESSERQKTSTEQGSNSAPAAVLTVWKKSLLPNCNGFTVFNSQGSLLFRVDNYIARNKDEILLMDDAGRPLLTIRQKRLSFGENWLVYEGEATGKPIFTAKKHVNILNKRCLAQLLRYEDGHKKKEVVYEIEGSYSQRCCAVFDNKRRKVAEIKKKEAVAGGVAFGSDIFRLIVQPDMDATLAMAFVILLDQMFGS